MKGLDVVQSWIEAEERALAEGYNGLRIAGNMSFLTPDDWPTLLEYEQAVTAHFNGRRIVALCSYPLAQCYDQQISEIMHAHHCALERLDSDWQVVTGPQLPVGSESGSWPDQSGRLALHEAGHRLRATPFGRLSIVRPPSPPPAANGTMRQAVNGITAL